MEVMLKNAPIVPYIPATDVARARKFYEEKVGLVPREEVAGGVVYECGNHSMPGMKTVNGIATAGGSKAAWFKDSEGNILAVIQTLKA